MWAHKRARWIICFLFRWSHLQNTQLERLSRVVQRNSTFECLCGNWFKIELLLCYFIFFRPSSTKQATCSRSHSLGFLFSALRYWEISMLYNIQTSRKAAVCWRRESERSDDKAQRRSRRKEKFILENSPVHTIFFLLLYYFSSQRELESIFCYFVPCCGASVVPDELWTIVNSLHEPQLCSLFPRVISLLIFAMGTRARVILFHWIGQSVFYIRTCCKLVFSHPIDDDDDERERTEKWKSQIKAGLLQPPNWRNWEMNEVFQQYRSSRSIHIEFPILSGRESSYVALELWFSPLLSSKWFDTRIELFSVSIQIDCRPFFLFVLTDTQSRRTVLLVSQSYLYVMFQFLHYRRIYTTVLSEINNLLVLGVCCRHDNWLFSLCNFFFPLSLLSFPKFPCVILEQTENVLI